MIEKNIKKVERTNLTDLTISIWTERDKILDLTLTIFTYKIPKLLVWMYFDQIILIISFSQKKKINNIPYKIGINPK